MLCSCGTSSEALLLICPAVELLLPVANWHTCHRDVQHVWDATLIRPVHRDSVGPFRSKAKLPIAEAQTSVS